MGRFKESFIGYHEELKTITNINAFNYKTLLVKLYPELLKAVLEKDRKLDEEIRRKKNSSEKPWKSPLPRWMTPLKDVNGEIKGIIVIEGFANGPSTILDVNGNLYSTESLLGYRPSSIVPYEDDAFSDRAIQVFKTLEDHLNRLSSNKQNHPETDL